MSASTLAFRTGPIIALVGMGFGIYMAASGDHSAAAAHAHLNLLGFVSTIVMGLVYRLDASIDGGSLARAQIILWIVSAVVMFPSLVMMFWGHPAFEMGATISSLGAIIAMILFAINVFRLTANR